MKEVAPTVSSAVVADDYQLTAVDKRGKPCPPAYTAADIMARAALAALASFRRLHLPVAMPKLVTIATDAATAEAVTSRVPSLAGTVASVVRNLGVDFTMKNVRRTPTFAARFRKATAKAGRLARAKKRGVRTRGVWISWPEP